MKTNVHALVHMQRVATQNAAECARSVAVGGCVGMRL